MILFIPWHFPLHKDTSITGASEKAEKEFQKLYPAIYNHLFEYKDKLEDRNKAETGIRYEWYALQRCAATYYEELEKEKIVWLEISDKANYGYDSEGSFLTNSAYFMVGNDLKFVLGLLNSKLLDFYFFQKTAQIAGGRKRYTKQYVSELRIPDPTIVDTKPITTLANEILSAKKADPKADTSRQEAEIDRLVYKLYDLTDEEIAIVEGAG